MTEETRSTKKKKTQVKKFLRNPKTLSIVIILIIVSVAVGIYSYISYTKTGTITPTMELLDGRPTVRFIDVGQGDATLVTYKSESVLIDAGTRIGGPETAEYVSLYAPKLDYFIITHQHGDHMGGAADILDTVDVENFVLSDITVGDKFYSDAIRKAYKKGVNIIYLDDAAEFNTGHINIEILDVFDFEYTDLNDSSLIIRIEAGMTTLLVTGDAEAPLEEYMLKKDKESLDCDILKVGHHGSSSSTTYRFLCAVSPDISVISCGRNNSYGHPTNQVLTRLERYGTEIHRTDREGTVVIHGWGN
ncbi:MAG: MBL fold metallo-hydrolase [Ruminococcaceae bacterium]|nr:MBL fold metallo-hydrolase [Oscillospiraceae bacterium]